MNNIVTLLPPRPARISAKLRHAINLMARQGLSQTDAAKEAGLSRQGLAKALGRAAVRDLLEAERMRFIAEADRNRVWARARAIDVALHLMIHAKSEAVRARMCEFLAADAKVSPVSVHIDARQEPPASGYIYQRPGSVTAAAEVEAIEVQDGDAE